MTFEVKVYPHRIWFCVCLIVRLFAKNFYIIILSTVRDKRIGNDLQSQRSLSDADLYRNIITHTAYYFSIDLFVFNGIMKNKSSETPALICFTSTKPDNAFSPPFSHIGSRAAGPCWITLLVSRPFKRLVTFLTYPGPRLYDRFLRPVTYCMVLPPTGVR